MILRPFVDDYEAQFPAHWRRLCAEIRQDDGDAFWMISHAGYIFRTGGVLWGLDLTLRTPEMLQAVADTIADDMAPLDFILVSHLHSDHFRPKFCKAMYKTPWILPAFMTDGERADIPLSPEQVTYIEVGDTLHRGPLTITAFRGPHDAADGTGPVPALSFAVSYNGHRLHFPGDIRDYATDGNFAATYRAMCAPCDAAFVHVWYGKDHGRIRTETPLSRQFTDYFSGFDTKRLYLAHLNDYSRSPDQRWTDEHAQLAKDSLQARHPQWQITAPIIGKRNDLSFG